MRKISHILMLLAMFVQNVLAGPVDAQFNKWRKELQSMPITGNMIKQKAGSYEFMDIFNALTTAKVAPFKKFAKRKANTAEEEAMIKAVMLEQIYDLGHSTPSNGDLNSSVEKVFRVLEKMVWSRSYRNDPTHYQRAKCLAYGEIAQNMWASLYGKGLSPSEVINITRTKLKQLAAESEKKKKGGIILKEDVGNMLHLDKLEKWFTDIVTKEGGMLITADHPLAKAMQTNKASKLATKLFSGGTKAFAKEDGFSKYLKKATRSSKKSKKKKKSRQAKPILAIYDETLAEKQAATKERKRKEVERKEAEEQKQREEEAERKRKEAEEKKQREEEEAERKRKEAEEKKQREEEEHKRVAAEEKKQREEEEERKRKEAEEQKQREEEERAREEEAERKRKEAEEKRQREEEERARKEAEELRKLKSEYGLSSLSAYQFTELKIALGDSFEKDPVKESIKALATKFTGVFTQSESMLGDLRKALQKQNAAGAKSLKSLMKKLKVSEGMKDSFSLAKELVVMSRNFAGDKSLEVNLSTSAAVTPKTAEVLSYWAEINSLKEASNRDFLLYLYRELYAATKDDGVYKAVKKEAGNIAIDEENREFFVSIMKGSNEPTENYAERAKYALKLLTNKVNATNTVYEFVNGLLTGEVTKLESLEKLASLSEDFAKPGVAAMVTTVWKDHTALTEDSASEDMFISFIDAIAVLLKKDNFKKLYDQANTLKHKKDESKTGLAMFYGVNLITELAEQSEILSALRDYVEFINALDQDHADKALIVMQAYQKISFSTDIEKAKQVSDHLARLDESTDLSAIQEAIDKVELSDLVVKVEETASYAAANKALKKVLGDIELDKQLIQKFINKSDGSLNKTDLQQFVDFLKNEGLERLKRLNMEFRELPYPGPSIRGSLTKWYDSNIKKLEQQANTKKYYDKLTRKYQDYRKFRNIKTIVKKLQEDSFDGDIISEKEFQNFVESIDKLVSAKNKYTTSSSALDFAATKARGPKNNKKALVTMLEERLNQK